MTKRIVVALSSATKEQDKAFIEYLKDQQIGWWHWVANFWLLVDHSGKETAEHLNLELEKIYPQVIRLVLERHGKDAHWSGFGPDGKERDMSKWLIKNW